MKPPCTRRDWLRSLFYGPAALFTLEAFKAKRCDAMAAIAESFYSPLAPHNPQGPCSLAASFQVAASLPNFLIQERGDNEYADLLAKPLPPIKNGYRPLLTEPGLGITIDEDKLKAQVGEPRQYLPRFDPDDGSV